MDVSIVIAKNGKQLLKLCHRNEKDLEDLIAEGEIEILGNDYQIVKTHYNETFHTVTVEVIETEEDDGE